MRITFTLLFLIFIITCQGQTFQVIQSNQTRYYQMENTNIAMSLHVSALSFIGGDSIFTLEPQMINTAHPDEWDCYNNIASWLGSSLRIAPNGDTYITSALNEEILLRTQAEPGEMWIAWNAPDNSMHLEAEMSSISEELVMDQAEMVRTIQLNMQHEQGSTASTDFEQSVVKIGANSGLIESPQWAGFPLRSDATAIMNAGPAQLRGIENIAGWQDFSWMEVMDFDPGDEIHIDEGGSLGSALTSWTKSAITFLSREDYPDSIVYEVQRNWNSYNAIVAPGEEPVSNSGTAFESMVIYPDSLFDTHAYAPVFFEDMAYAGYSIMGIVGEQRYKSHGIEAAITPCMDHYNATENCYAPTLHASCTAGACFPGLGGPYYDFEFESGPGGSWRKLLYYKKDTMEWGSPLGTSEGYSNHKALLQTYPNPTRSTFRIVLEDQAYPATVRAFDLRGQLLHQQVLNGQAQEVQLPSMPAQMLILQVTTSAGNVRGGRIFYIE